jgi:RNA polymerase sigma-70 factor (ECF subfamily)
VAQVRGFARTLVVEPDSDDIVAATFRTAWIRLDDIPPDAQKAWLFGVVRHHTLNYTRGERRREALIDALGTLQPAEGVGLHYGRLDPIETDTLLQALERLTAIEREVLQLAAWHELHPAEIATVLGIRPSAARVRLHRARQHLEELVRESEAKEERDV